jgi:hypothetical protein
VNRPSYRRQSPRYKQLFNFSFIKKEIYLNNKRKQKGREANPFGHLDTLLASCTFGK